MKASHLRTALVAVAATLLASAALAAAESGPTPYPDPKDEAAWPGVGPIRVFNEWMPKDRQRFWANREKDRGAIAFVGDSLTGGWDPKQFAESFKGLKVANRGIGGDVSRGVLFRFREDVLDLKPQAVVLCVGSNDLSAHAPPAGIEKNIVAILDMAQKAEPAVPVVLCTIPPRDAANSPTKPGAQADLNQRIAKLAAGREGVTLLDLFTPMAGPDGKPQAEFVKKDRIHMSTAGHAKWAELVRPILEKLIAKK